MSNFKKILKYILEKTFLFAVYKKIQRQSEIKKWTKKGKPIKPLTPEQIKKHMIIKEYAKKFPVKIFLEDLLCPHNRPVNLLFLPMQVVLPLHFWGWI